MATAEEVPLPPKGQSRLGKLPPGTGCSMRDWNQMLAQRKAPQLRRVTAAELREHAESGDLWIAIRGVVFDCSSWARFHPGGKQILLECGGKDATKVYDHYHGYVALEPILGPFAVGMLERPSAPLPPPEAAPAPAAAAPAAAPAVPVPEATPAEAGEAPPTPE